MSEEARRSQTILVVEDEELVRGLLKRTLDRLGHRSVLAGNVAEAIAAATGETVDILLTDIALPDGTGPHLAELVRAIVPGVHVLFMSGRTASSVRSANVIDAQDTLLEKPFTIESLDRAIRAAWTRTPSAREPSGP